MSISNLRSLSAMRIASCIYMFCIRWPQVHAAALCDTAACPLSETGLPEVSQALLQLNSDASRKPANEEDMDARKAVTKSVITETLTRQKDLDDSLKASKIVEEQKHRVEQSVKEKNQAAQAVLDDLQEAKADADQKVEKSKKEATKVAAKKLELYRLALQKATAERVATETVLTQKHRAERDALQKFAVVQTIMEQNEISDDSKAKKRNGKHAKQEGDANANANDADEDQDAHAASEDNAEGNVSAPTAPDAKAKKRNGKYASQNRKRTSVLGKPAAVQQVKKSEPASTGWFS